MRIYQRQKVWYIDYTSQNGKRVRKRVGHSKDQARLALKAVEIDLVKGKYLGISEPEKMIFEKLCGEYLTYARTNKTASSFRRDQVSINALLKTFGNCQIKDITAHDIDYHINQRKVTLKNSTVNREVACIKHMFNKAVEWGYLLNNPLKTVKKLKEPPGRIRYLNAEEIERLMVQCADHIKPIVVMALNTGMRKGEILHLQWGDIDFKNRILHIRQTKNNEHKTIPINDTLLNCLLGLSPQLSNQYVFANPEGNPYTDVKTGFSRAVQRAGITDFRFHDLRHTFASRLVMAGTDLRTVQVLLGHKDIKMTMRYSHLSDTHLREAVNKLENGTNPAQAENEKSATSAKVG